METVNVRIDDRIRLVSALLAATSWPNDEQQRKPHGTHAHARDTRKLLAAHTKHPAALIMQALLDRGVPLEDVYAHVLKLAWPGLAGTETPPWLPPTWVRHLLNFYDQAGLARWWQDETAAWAKGREEAEKVFAGVDLRSFLQPFVGDFEDALIFMPNVSYPTDTVIGVCVEGELYCVAPPRLAWGNNPPWSFDEDPAYVYDCALTQYGRMLMRRYLHQHPEVLAEVSQRPLPLPKPLDQAYASWEEGFLALFTSGLVAIFLEDAVSKQEADAYVLMERKVQGVSILPGVISVLRRFLGGHRDGQYPTFIDYLPHFGAHLRVARTITTL